MKRSRWLAMAAVTLSAATIVAACGDGDDDADAADATDAAEDAGATEDTGAAEDAGATEDADATEDAEGDFVLGVSNTLAGNGWREQMICAVKAEALARGTVSEVIVISKNGGPTEQIQDLQSLISQGVDAIIVNPSDREALNPVIEEAIAQGIVVVAVDQAVTAEGAYIATNDQVAYGRLGMEWLAEELGGEGNVLYLRGIDGVPADADRHQGVTEVLEANPGITVKEIFTGWDFTKAGEIAVTELGAADYAGVWTSGTDYTVVNAFETVGKEPVPVVGADTNGFIAQLLEGSPGAAVTNPAVIGGVGAAVALDVLGGEDAEQETLLTPEVWDLENTPDTLEEFNFPDRDENGSAAATIEGYTSYTAEQLFACTGPGE
jgi:ribose transport system substrate-binding protein